MTTSELHELSLKLGFSGIRSLLQVFCDSHPDGQRLWDVLTCLRGPDSPSERPDLDAKLNDTLYRGRRERKARTVEVIRGAFVHSGGARWREAKAVKLPPSGEWDHFDRHVAKAAAALGIPIETIERPKNGVTVEWVEAPPKVKWAKEKMIKQVEPDDDQLSCDHCGKLYYANDAFSCIHGNNYCSEECCYEECPDSAPSEEEEE